MMSKKATNIEGKIICDKCGYPNEPGVQECVQCQSKRFAPNWVVAKRPINRQVSVDITMSNPQYGTSQKRITLSKWWPGGGASFNIPNATQWDAIQKIINEDLCTNMGWKSKKEQAAQIKERIKVDQEIDGTVKELVDQHPDLILKLVYSLDTEKLAQKDIDTIVEILSRLAEVISNGTAGFREACIAILQRLPKQGQKALERLEDLLQSWSLQQIVSVAQTVRARLESLELFKSQIMNERTFEIRGDNSIHRILEKAMWMIDERYWLLQSNSTLRKLIGEKMSKKDQKRYGKKRPDFVCGSVGSKLIIVELKKPSKTLTIEDLNQLETYLTISEEYSTDYGSYEAYLIGNSKDSDLMRRMKHRSTNFKVWTYADLVDRTEQRYQEYLKAEKS
jgi:hypothetical protein